LIADELVLQLATFLRSLDLFLEFTAAAMRASERPGSAQAPILFPPGEPSVAKLQREG